MASTAPASGYSSTSSMDALARRRRRLGMDYRLETRDMLELHSGHSPWINGAMSHCFTSIRRQFLPHYFHSAPGWRVWIRRLNTDRALPDFCIIGPAKSGSSDLAITIMSHPNVLHPLVKELSSNDPLAWRPFYPTVKAVKRRARRYGLALCPFIAPYLHILDIPTVLSTHRPHTKVVINLRNPVDLVFSEWKWIVLHTTQQLLERVPFIATFPAFVDKALELFPEAPAPFYPGLHYGIYATSVGHWLRAFGKQNVRIFDVADYFTDRNAYFDRLQEFLDLPHISLPTRLSVTNRNPLTGLKPDLQASAKLKGFFEPYNRRLWEVIDTQYSW